MPIETHAVTMSFPTELRAAAQARNVDWNKVLQLVRQYGQLLFTVLGSVLPLIGTDGTVDPAALLALATKYGPEIINDVLSLFGKMTVAPAQ